MKRIVLAVCLVGSTATLAAQHRAVGTWVLRPDPQTKHKPNMVMTIEDKGDTRTITYKTPGLKDPSQTILTTVVTRMQGEDAPVLINGKPSGETMAIKRTGPDQTTTILKMNGKQFGISVAELSADGKVLKVENEITSAEGGRRPGKTVGYWDKQ